jgi:DNA adenine methylase
MFPYIGGKAHHIRHLDRIFPLEPLDTFVDVFGGAGWVTVRSQASQRALTRVYNDANPHLANIFHWFSKDPSAVLAQLKSWPQQDADLYRQFQQDIFGATPEPAATAITAAKYLYIEVQSFSGNTLGLNSSVYFDSIHTIQPLIKKLQHQPTLNSLQSITLVENLDCCAVIDRYDSPDAFFYCDPPYYEKEHYYTHAFGREAHKALAQRLQRCQGRWALSYYEFDELGEWFPRDKYTWHTYSISKQSSSRRRKTRGQEVVITNYA